LTQNIKSLTLTFFCLLTSLILKPIKA